MVGERKATLVPSDISTIEFSSKMAPHWCQVFASTKFEEHPLNILQHSFSNKGKLGTLGS